MREQLGSLVDARAFRSPSCTRPRAASTTASATGPARVGGRCGWTPAASPSDPTPPAVGGSLHVLPRGESGPTCAAVHERVRRRVAGGISRTAPWWDAVLGDTDVYLGGTAGPPGDGAPRRCRRHGRLRDLQGRPRLERRPGAPRAGGLGARRGVGRGRAGALASPRRARPRRDGGRTDRGRPSAVGRGPGRPTGRHRLAAGPPVGPSARRRRVARGAPLRVARPARGAAWTTRSCPQVGGTFELVVDERGVGTCRRTEGPCELQLGVSELGSLLLGGSSVRRLARAGRATASPETLVRADEMFGDRPACRGAGCASERSSCDDRAR